MIITLPPYPVPSFFTQKFVLLLRIDTKEAEEEFLEIHSTHQLRPRDHNSNNALREIGYPASYQIENRLENFTAGNS